MFKYNFSDPVSIILHKIQMVISFLKFPRRSHFIANFGVPNLGLQACTR